MKKPGSQRKSTVIWFCVLFFVSLWMFVLGIYVGRGTAPVHFDIQKLQNELSKLKEAILEQEKNRFKIESRTLNKEPMVEFYDALKENQKEEKQKPSVKSPRPAPETAVAVKKSEPEAPLKKDDAESGKAGEAPKPSETIQLRADRPYTIQVAAVKEAKEAGKMVERLQVMGFPAYKEFAQISGKGGWYRIRIGSFKNHEEAMDMMDRLKRENFRPILVK